MKTITDIYKQMTDFALNEKQARVYLDDILLEVIPSCPRPYGFSFVTHSDTSLTFSFSHDGAVKYEFKCGAVGFDPTTDAGVVTEFTTKTAEAKGLAPATEYDIYVRAFCNDTDASPWTYVDTRTTLKGFIREMPYFCNFEGTDVNSKWAFAQEDQTDKWYIGVDAAFEVSEDKSNTDSALYISYDNGLSMQYFNNGKDKTMMPESYSWAYVTIYLEKGKYDKAEELFKELGDYGDSKEMIKECSYRKALSFIEGKKYTEAIEILSTMKKYSEASELILSLTHHLFDNGDKLL